MTCPPGSIARTSRGVFGSVLSISATSQPPLDADRKWRGSSSSIAEPPTAPLRHVRPDECTKTSVRIFQPARMRAQRQRTVSADGAESPQQVHRRVLLGELQRITVKIIRFGRSRGSWDQWIEYPLVGWDSHSF